MHVCISVHFVCSFIGALPTSIHTIFFSVRFSLSLSARVVIVVGVAKSAHVSHVYACIPSVEMHFKLLSTYDV